MTQFVPRTEALAPEEPARSLLNDTYDDVSVARGSVVGSTATTGARRGGVDAEGLMSIDNGALRLRPLSRPGWGREGVAYGPLPRRPGLAAAFQVLNGHHCSQTFYMPESRRGMVRRWLGALRRGTWPRRPRHYENLAAGLFASPAPTEPILQGHGIVVHAVTEQNGELWASVCGRPLRVLTGLQNLPMAVFVVLREHGAIYYAATVPDDPALPCLPDVRPLALDPVAAGFPLHPGVHQRILGEVGYRVDTRVYRTEAAVVPWLADWCTSAVVADRLVSDGRLHGRSAERGGPWAATGDLRAGVEGAAGTGEARILAPESLGLVHATISAPRGGWADLVFRAEAPVGPAWRVRVSDSGAVLMRSAGDETAEVARAPRPHLVPGRSHSLQVLDDGRTLSVHLDGQMLFGRWVEDGRGAAATGVGFALGGGARLLDFEGHPRSVPAPLVQEPAWGDTPLGVTVILDEHFDGPPGPLDGAATGSGGQSWERVEGQGVFDLLPGGGAQVRASNEAPNPGRTIYAVPWGDSSAADVRVTVLPPGSGRGARHNCRAGLVLWQDPENYIVVNVWLDDWLESSSLSSFYRVRGHEDMYDAVWTLTGDRVTWGVPFELRVAFDGERFTAYLDGRPTLYRALRDVYPDAPRLAVRRIALVANEEWGDDTGSTFLRLLALAPEVGQDDDEGVT